MLYSLRAKLTLDLTLDLNAALTPGVSNG